MYLKKENNSTLGLITLSILGVSSILFSDFPILKTYNIPIITILFQPLILSILSIFLGLYLLKNSKYSLSEFHNKKKLLSISKNGVFASITLGVFLGGLLYIIYPHFQNLLPSFFNKFKINIITRILYGGINEELIMRFGLLTFLFYFFNKFSNYKTSILLSLILSSLLFALGHLPILYMEGNPRLSLLTYIIGFNFLFGLFFGIVYLRFGLLSSIICHSFTHLVHYTFILFLT